MKNIPRIYLSQKIMTGQVIPADKDTVHYLQKVMRTDKCLVFNDGVEFNAKLAPIENNGKIMHYELCIMDSTNHLDPSNDVTFCFAPIKKTDDMLNMVTQMGVAKLQPVITERTVAHHINWKRMEKIIIEASEQSNRNSVPELMPAQKFDEFLQEAGTGSRKLYFADERTAYTNNEYRITNNDKNGITVFVGPEGGFSSAEFDALDKSGAHPMSLGKTILRAEVAAVAALAKLI